MNVIEEAKKVLKIEADAILALTDRVDDSFLKAAQVLLACKGKLITTGIGKSGIIARKLAATFSSTGTPAMFLHPAESAHGDLGVISEGDVLLAISYRGEAPELHAVLNFAARKGIPVIALTGQVKSRLATSAEIVLDVSISAEACPLNLAPTASTTAALAMGDALAMAVMMQKGLTAEDFAEYHPGGSLGKKLLKVKDLMHSGAALPLVQLSTAMKQVVSEMTAKEVRGTAGVVDGAGDLIGVVTDGDLRRRLEKAENPLEGTAADIMNKNPKTIDFEELAEKALFFMEEFKIQVLFVVDKNSGSPKKPIGLVHLQDLIKSKVL